MKKLFAACMACALVFAQSYTYNPFTKRLDAIGTSTTYTGGASGAVTVDNVANTIDLTSGVVPLLASANAFTGLNSWTPSATQSITAVGNTVLANANNVAVSPTSNLTLTSTPTIANGVDGQMLKICNVSTSFTLTLQDEANLVGSNIRGDGANVTLSPRQCRIAEFRSAINDWVFVPAASNSSPIVPYQETNNACAGSTGTTTASDYGVSWHQPATTTSRPAGQESFSNAGSWTLAGDGPSPCYWLFNFDASNDRWVFSRHTLPLSWVSGQNVTFAYQFFGSATATAQFNVKYACVSSTTATPYTVPAPGAFTTVESFNASVTANAIMFRTVSMALSGCSANDTLWVQYLRPLNTYSGGSVGLLRSIVVSKVQ